MTMLELSSASGRHTGVHHDLHPARGLGRTAGRLRLRAQPPDGAHPAQADHGAGPGLRPVPPGRGLGRGPGRGHPRRARALPLSRIHRRGAAGRKREAARPGQAGHDRTGAAHARARHRGRPGVSRHARGGCHGDRGHAGRGPGRLDVGGTARGEHRGRPAPRHGRERQRVLRLQRPGDRDRLAARPGRGADRVRRRGRPPRGRGGAGVLGRPEGADHRAARASGVPVPRDRLAG